MNGNDKGSTNFDLASKRLPAFMAGGLLGGLLVGIVVGNIPYGVAGGVMAAPLVWLVVAGRLSNRLQTPTSRAMAVAIVAVWVIAIGALGLWVWRAVRT